MTYISEVSDRFNLTAASWISQIEDELGNQFIDEPLTTSSSESRTEYVDEDDEILTTDFDEESSCRLLNSLSCVVVNLKNTVKNHIDNKDNKDDKEFSIESFCDRLRWAKKLSCYMAKKLDLDDIKHSNYKNSSVPRSSYKFCDFGKDCSYNYNHSKYDGCYAQHFVYNHLAADIDALISYIELNKGSKLRFIEILTCMNTICYVTNHMKDEYMGIMVYYSDNAEKMHRERTPIDKKKRKNKNVHVKN